MTTKRSSGRSRTNRLPLGPRGVTAPGCAGRSHSAVAATHVRALSVSYTHLPLRQSKGDDDRLARQHRLLGHDEHALRGEVDAAAADEPEIAFADDLAVDPDGTTERAALLSVNECPEHDLVVPFCVPQIVSFGGAAGATSLDRRHVRRRLAPRFYLDGVFFWL